MKQDFAKFDYPAKELSNC